MDLNLDAQQFLFGTHKAILSTHSAKYDGYPYGSVAPFVLDRQGMPTILISTIAEHTKNIIANAHVSLVVFNNEEDLQANARLTLLAIAKPANKNDTLLRERYLRYLPQAEQYFDMHDFSFYTLEVTHARHIAGFGKMGWLEGQDIKMQANALYNEEPAILTHMNADHQENMKAYCQQYHQVKANSVSMVGIDSLGFDIRADGQLLRFHFDHAITNAETARSALVAMAKASRTCA